MSEIASRTLALLSLLQAQREWSGDALAARLDISPRTIRRDVTRLRELGYPVQAGRGPGGLYQLGRGPHLPPLVFDDGIATISDRPGSSTASCSSVTRCVAMIGDHMSRQIVAPTS